MPKTLLAVWQDEECNMWTTSIEVENQFPADKNAIHEKVAFEWDSEYQAGWLNEVFLIGGQIEYIG